MMFETEPVAAFLWCCGHGLSAFVSAAVLLLVYGMIFALSQLPEEKIRVLAHERRNFKIEKVSSHLQDILAKAYTSRTTIFVVSPLVLITTSRN